ncbi:hypothetical protein D9M71_245140 [compost metagenome]
MKPMPCGSWLTESDSLTLDSKRLAVAARLLPWLLRTSSLKVSQVPELSSRAYRLIAPPRPPSSSQVFTSPEKTWASWATDSAVSGLAGCRITARPSMAITCSPSGLFRSPRRARLAASLSLIGREEAASSALLLSRATNPVLEPWAAMAMLTRRPLSSRAVTRCSFSPLSSMRTSVKPSFSSMPPTSAGPSLAPMVLEPCRRRAGLPSVGRGRAAKLPSGVAMASNPPNSRRAVKGRRRGERSMAAGNLVGQV